MMTLEQNDLFLKIFPLPYTELQHHGLCHLPHWAIKILIIKKNAHTFQPL